VGELKLSARDKRSDPASLLPTPTNSFGIAVDGGLFYHNAINVFEIMFDQLVVEEPLDEMLHRKQKAIGLSDLQLHELRENSTHTLTVMAGSDENFYSSISDQLTQNSSVTNLVFKSGATGESDSKSQIQPGDWVSLFAAFRSSSKQITSLKLLGCDIPFYTIPTMLWQFRNLTHLQLEENCGFRWTEKHWQLLSAALRNHPNLVSFNMALSDNDLQIHAPNDTLVATLAATVPTLKEYIQKGCCTKAARADSQAPTIRMESVVTLIRSTSLDKVACSHLRILSTNSPLALSEALKSTNLVQLSLPCNDIDGPLASRIFQGLQVSRRSFIFHAGLSIIISTATVSHFLSDDFHTSAGQQVTRNARFARERVRSTPRCHSIARSDARTQHNAHVLGFDRLPFQDLKLH